MQEKIKLNLNSLYYAISCLYFFSILMGTANSENLFMVPISLFQTIMRYCTLIVLLIIFVFNIRKFHVKTIIAMSVIVVIVGIVYTRIDDAIMMLTLLFVFTGKNIDNKRLSKHMCRTILYTSIFIMFMCLIGVYPDVYLARSGSTRMGHSLGFLGANALASTVFIGLIYYVYANKDDWKRKNYVISTLILLVTFLITRARMTFILECLLMICYWFLRKNKGRNICFILQKYSYIFFSVMTLFMAKWYESNPSGILQNLINSFTTGRLYWIYYFDKTYGLSFLGQNVNLIGVKTATLTGANWQNMDNAYAMLAIHYGVIILVVLSIACILLGSYLKKKNDYIGALCVFILAVWGLTENSITIICYNLGFYLMTDMLWKNND